MVSLGTVTGCCVATNIYNLGGAHGHVRAINQEEFDLKFRGKGWNNAVVAFTSMYQKPEREFLKVQGWREEQVNNNISVHTIRGDVLRKYMFEREPVLKEYLAKKNPPATKSVFTNTTVPGIVDLVGPRRNGIYHGLVTTDRVARLRPRGLTPQETRRGWLNAIETYYGVRPWIAHGGEHIHVIRRRVYDMIYRQRVNAGQL